MPVGGRWSSGAAATALAALLLLPAQYLLPERAPPPPPPAPPPASLAFAELPPLDSVVTCALIVFSVLVYLCEWIQRKLMERRIKKLQEWLGGSARRLAAWDAQQAQLEGALRLVRGAAAECGVLLLLLLRRQRPPPPLVFLKRPGGKPAPVL